MRRHIGTDGRGVLIVAYGGYTARTVGARHCSVREGVRAQVGSGGGRPFTLARGPIAARLVRRSVRAPKDTAARNTRIVFTPPSPPSP